MSESSDHSGKRIYDQMMNEFNLADDVKFTHQITVPESQHRKNLFGGESLNNSKVESSFMQEAN